MRDLQKNLAALGALSSLITSTWAHAADDPAARVDAIFAAYAAPNAPGCAVAVSEAGRVAFAKGYGAADLAWGRPITPDTTFDVASVSKQFTAFAVVLLAERGVLSLKDDVRKHLPDLPNWGATVTLEHLLDHTSGLPSYDTIATVVGRPGRGEMNTELAYALARRIEALDFPPGSDWSYSNTNYLLLARIAEKVSGRPLGAFLTAEAFGPASMKATRFAPDLGEPTPGRAKGYTPTPGGGFREGPIGGSDGGSRGVQSNVGDLLAWAHAFDSERFGAGVRRTMTTPWSRIDGAPVRYAAGLDIDRLNGRVAVRHNGSDWRGYTSELLRLPEAGLAVAVLCNRSDAAADALAERVAAAWLDEPADGGGATRALSDLQRAAAGRYVAADGRAFELRAEGERMAARPLVSGLLTAVDDRSFAFGLPSRGARLVIGQEPGTVRVIPPVGRAVEYRRYEPVAPGLEALAAYEGRYLSDAFEAVLPVKVEGGVLTVTDLNGAPRALAATTQDRFVLGGNTGFTFERDPSGKVFRLVVSQARARRLVFNRLQGR